MSEEAWAAQAESLIRVQREGGNLEHTVRGILGWPRGRVVYDRERGYSLQVDAAFPSASSPAIVASSTYTKPGRRGHSNENKFQLKVGELALLKRAFPDIRVLLAIGGSGDDWLPYVLRAFRVFYDEVLFLWQEADRDRLRGISRHPASVPLRNQALWSDLRLAWANVQLAAVNSPIPNGLVRYKILDILHAQTPAVTEPRLIENEVARFCMQTSHDHSGKEWQRYLAEEWGTLEMSRNYFNPVEASVEITLRNARLWYEGGVGRDVKIQSLLHHLGMEETSVAEDFVLYSRKLKMPVYIQCKASGGGRSQHGKNIQNRGKEQIARSLLYRCGVVGGKISWRPKDFHWIGVLDGNWGVTRRHPYKYIHMLQWAGYDKIVGASDLLTDTFEVKRQGNPLTQHLIDELECELVR